MALRDLAGRQRLHAAELKCRRQDAGVAGQHHGQPNYLRQRPAGGDEAVPPHKHDPPGGQYLGKISALMGDVAKGIKSFKKGMSEDPDAEKVENKEDAVAEQAIDVTPETAKDKA